MACNLLNRLKQSILDLNLYKISTSTIHILPEEHLATRTSLCLVAGTIGIHCEKNRRIKTLIVLENDQIPLKRFFRSSE